MSTVAAATGGGADAPRRRAVPLEELTDANLEALAQLLVASYGKWPGYALDVSAAEHLRWKFSNPDGEGGFAVLTEVGNRIAGLVVRAPRWFRVQGQRWRVGLAVDAAVHPDFAGRGLYRAALAHAEELEERFDISMGVSLNPAVLHVLGTQLRFGNPPRVLFLPFDARALVRDFIPQARGGISSRAAAFGLSTISRAARLRRAAVRRSGVVTVAAVERFDERVEHLFAQAAAPYDFIGERTTASLNWRYCDPRGGRFTALAAESGQELVGFAVVKVDGGRGYLVDLLALPDRDDAAVALVDEALRLCQDAGAHGVMCWMPERHPYRRLLRSRGFVDSRRDSGFWYRPAGLDPTVSAFLATQRAGLHLVHGDTDVV